ncbi:MAG: DinB family protein [Bacteroidia bacterium]|nr:DinB family protein [Bacteroidia bacterium]
MPLPSTLNKIQSWKTEIQETTRAFREAFGKLSPEQLNMQPNPGVWSVAQIMDHLITINHTYYPMVEGIRKDTYKPPFHGRFPFIVNFLGNFILNSVEPERKRKIKTFPIWEPSQSQISGDIVTRFEKHQKELAAWMESCGDLIDKRQVVHSPASKVIVYSLERAFDIITTHEKRHLNQAKETFAMLKH